MYNINFTNIKKGNILHPEEVSAYQSSKFVCTVTSNILTLKRKELYLEHTAIIGRECDCKDEFFIYIFE